MRVIGIEAVEHPASEHTLPEDLRGWQHVLLTYGRCGTDHLCRQWVLLPPNAAPARLAKLLVDMQTEDADKQARAVLEFPLPECEDEARDALNASRVMAGFREFRRHLHGWFDGGREFKSADDAIDAVWQLFQDELGEHCQA